MKDASRIIGRVLTTALLVACLISTSFGIDLDGSFGTGGRFTTTFASTNSPSSFGRYVYVQPSGRVVTVGSHSQLTSDGRMNGIAVAGLTGGGVLDGTFGNGGKILLWDSISNQSLADSVMLPDGSLLFLY